MARARFLVHGLVQGVGYRWFVRRAAGRLGLSGIARNLPDGDVEVLAEGTDESLQELERELRRGPSASRVERVEKRELPHEIPLPKSFEIE
ncbi:MAG TPA: acylphosphatase [Gemmatimonadales bacterium]|nr:acylphosphatase [Gemmatimonadales bacterium]